MFSSHKATENKDVNLLIRDVGKGKGVSQPFPQQGKVITKLPKLDMGYYTGGVDRIAGRRIKAPVKEDNTLTASAMRVQMSRSKPTKIAVAQPQPQQQARSMLKAPKNDAAKSLPEIKIPKAVARGMYKSKENSSNTSTDIIGVELPRSTKSFNKSEKRNRLHAIRFGFASKAEISFDDWLEDKNKEQSKVSKKQKMEQIKKSVEADERKQLAQEKYEEWLRNKQMKLAEKKLVQPPKTASKESIYSDFDIIETEKKPTEGLKEWDIEDIIEEQTRREEKLMQTKCLKLKQAPGYMADVSWKNWRNKAKNPEAKKDDVSCKDDVYLYSM